MRTIPMKETLTIEFKSDLKRLSDNELMETVIGMTNTDGGTLYLGVEDNGEISGVHKQYADEIVGKRTCRGKWKWKSESLYFKCKGI